MLWKVKYPTDKVFISMIGAPMKSNTINQALKQFCQKTLVLDEAKLKRFSNTMVRKATVTNTRDNVDKVKGNLATLMLHSVNTANASYDLPDKIQKAASGHDVVLNLYATPSKKQPTPTETTRFETTLKLEMEVENKGEEQQPDSQETMVPESIVTSTNTIPPSPPQGSRSVTFATRRAWTKEDTDIIMEEAGSIIEGPVRATRLNIQSRIAQSKRLRQIANKEGAGRLFEKIKSIKKSLEKGKL